MITRKTLTTVTAIFIITICLGIVLCGCGNDKAENSSENSVSSETATTETTTELKQGDESQFIRKITGLWLNGSQSAADAKNTAHAVGSTDSSMTEFIERDGICYMTTIGDISGQYDGDTVPAVNGEAITFTYISPDLTKAEGTVGGRDISFDLGPADDQVIYYSCGGYYTHCAYTGFSSESEMAAYLQ